MNNTAKQNGISTTLQINEFNLIMVFLHIYFKFEEERIILLFFGSIKELCNNM